MIDLRVAVSLFLIVLNASLVFVFGCRLDWFRFCLDCLFCCCGCCECVVCFGLVSGWCGFSVVGCFRGCFWLCVLRLIVLF